MSVLPDGWTIHRPTLDDIPAILAMVHASDIAAVGEPDCTADEIREALTEPHTDPERDCWLVRDEAGTIVGWAYPHNPAGGDRDFIEVYVWPERGVPAQRPLLELIMARMRTRATELGHDPYTVRAGAIPTEQAYVAALTEAGFVFVKQHARMQMSLAGVSAEAPEPPPGVTLRPVRAGDETEMRAFHAVIEAAFLDSDHPGTGYDDWRRQVDGEATHNFDEWFVAEVDGVPAGVLQSSDSGAADGEGWVKRLAVLRAYRRRGLGEALLRRAFAAYARNGRTKVGLGVDMANPTRAARLYLAVGMIPLYQADIYETTVRAA
jgi:mycothiol synthase